jgi:hypothetical protein
VAAPSSSIGIEITEWSSPRAVRIRLVDFVLSKSAIPARLSGVCAQIISVNTIRTNSFFSSLDSWRARLRIVMYRSSISFVVRPELCEIPSLTNEVGTNSESRLQDHRCSHITNHSGCVDEQPIGVARRRRLLSARGPTGPSGRPYSDPLIAILCKFVYHIKSDIRLHK